MENSVNKLCDADCSNDGIDWEKVNEILTAIQGENNMVVDAHTGLTSPIEMVGIFGFPNDPLSQNVVWMPSSMRFKHIAGFSINKIEMIEGRPTVSRTSVGGTLIYRGKSLIDECLAYNNSRDMKITKHFLKVIDLNEI